MTDPFDQVKHCAVFCFADGKLRIKTSGHGSQDGWGEFVFHEQQMEFADGFAAIEVPPSELIELRDFLNRVLDTTLKDTKP